MSTHPLSIQVLSVSVKTFTFCMLHSCGIIYISWQILKRSYIVVTTNNVISLLQGLEHSEAQYLFDIILPKMVKLALRAPEICTQVCPVHVRYTLLLYLKIYTMFHCLLLKRWCLVDRPSWMKVPGRGVCVTVRAYVGLFSGCWVKEVVSEVHCHICTSLIKSRTNGGQR